MTIVAFYTHDSAPISGLHPNIVIYNAATGVTVVASTPMTDVGHGWYNYNFTPTVNIKYDFVCTAGSPLSVNEQTKIGSFENSNELLTAINAVPSSVWGSILAGSNITAAQLMRLISAVTSGKSSGSPSGPVKFRDVADTKDVVSATVDANGNRLTIVMDLS